MPSGAGEHQLAGGAVIDLPRHVEELEPHRHVADLLHAKREKIEVQRPIRGVGGARPGLPRLSGAGGAMNVLERRRLPA